MNLFEPTIFEQILRNRRNLISNDSLASEFIDFHNELDYLRNFLSLDNNLIVDELAILPQKSFSVPFEVLGVYVSKIMGDLVHSKFIQKEFRSKYQLERTEYLSDLSNYFFKSGLDLSSLNSLINDSSSLLKPDSFFNSLESIVNSDNLNILAKHFILNIFYNVDFGRELGYVKDVDDFLKSYTNAIPSCNSLSSALFSMTNIKDITMESFTGKGSEGLVYSAKHKRFQNPVAVKILYNTVNSESIEDRADVLRERIDNFANILKIYGTGVGELPASLGFIDYYFSEFVDGGSAEIRKSDGTRYLRDDIFGTNDLSNILTKMTEGVYELHRNGLVHGNIKLGNTFISKDHAKVKIGDFGTMLTFEQIANGATLQGGSLKTMAPELINDKSKISPSSDLYSLGVFIYETLTGDTKSMAILNKVDNKNSFYSCRDSIFDSHSEVIQNYKSLLENVLTFNPDDRLSSVDDVFSYF